MTFYLYGELNCPPKAKGAAAIAAAPLFFNSREGSEPPTTCIHKKVPTFIFKVVTNLVTNCIFKQK